MKIGVPKEIKPQENRIGLTPDSVKTLVSEGHEVLVENNGGFEAGFDNDQYIKAGAKIADTAGDIFKDVADNAEHFASFAKDGGKNIFLAAGAAKKLGLNMSAVAAATESLLSENLKVGHVSINWISPLPNDLGEILKQYKQVLIPEVNTGQFRQIIRAEFLVDAIGLNEVQGKPLGASKIEEKVKDLING